MVRSAALLCALVVLSWSLRAHAWIETAVRGHRATVTVGSDGKAEVRHELTLKVRGGPLDELHVAGIGAGVEPLADARVRRARNGSSSVWPLVQTAAEDGSLTLDVQAKRGLRGGTYQFEWGYRVDLGERQGLERIGDRARVTWVGPRLDSGVDLAKVTFRLPRGTAMPVLPPGDEGPAAGTLLTEVRRGGEFDEIDLVRAHVARGEPAVWQVEVSGSVFPGLSTTSPTHAVPTKQANSPVVLRADLPIRLPWLVGIGAGLALLWAALLTLKARAVASNCDRVGARPRPLVPLGTLIRVVLASSLLAGAAMLGLLEYPTWAGVALSGAALLSAWLPPQRTAMPRGPGTWAEFDESKVAEVSNARWSGSWLDGGTWRGLALWLLLGAIVLGGALWMLPTSAYRAALLGSLTLALVPVFFTGRHAELPADLVLAPLGLFGFLEQRFRKAGISARRLARTPLGAKQPDEVRLEILPQRHLEGLRSIEVGVEIGAGRLLLPCVIVRAQEDSAAHAALPRSVAWTRGRESDERVAIIRPRVPSRAQCLRVALGVTKALTTGHETGGAGQAPRRRTRSSGKGHATVKGVTPAPSPAT